MSHVLIKVKSSLNDAEDFWNKMSKYDNGVLVNQYLNKQFVGGVKFILYEQFGWSVAVQKKVWTHQALFSYGGKFFSIRSGENISRKEFDDLVTSFKFIPLGNQSVQTSNNNTPVSDNRLIKKIICSLSGNQIDDNQQQNGLTFVAQGESCATMSGFKPNTQDNETLTWNSMTKTWKYVLLSFYNAHFSSDGKHFVYTASNLPLPSPASSGDWKPQRFVVSDNVPGPTYDDIYFPQYSKDGTRLGYCATRNGQYLKIIDGKETQTTSKDYYETCDSLFGFKQGPETKSVYMSPDSSYTIVPTLCARDFCNSLVTVTPYPQGKSQQYGPYKNSNPGYFTFSPNSKYFAWLVGSNLYINGNLDNYSSSQGFNELFNVSFSPDSKSVTYNARLGKTVYYVSAPL